MRRTLGISTAAVMALTIAAGFAPRAMAVSMEQAQAKCREQVSPQVRECVRAKMMANQDRDPEKYIPGCRAPVVDKVRACIAKLIGAEGLKQQPAEAPKATKNTAVNIGSARPRTAPPRTIADITAILDQEKPDPERAKRMQAAADGAEPAKADAVARAHFHHNRALARSDLGRYAEAGADARRAVELSAGKVADVVLNNFRQTAALQHVYAGEPKLALDMYLKMAEETEKSAGKGFLFTAYRLITNLYLQLGDLERAQTYVQKIEAAWKSASSRPGYADHGPNWRASVDDAKGKLFEARGRLEEALAAFETAEATRRNNIDKSARAMVAVPRAHLEQAADLQLLGIARVKAKLGRLAEAETDARRALLNRLRATGKYAPQTARYIAALGMLMVEQGRYEDAKKLIATTVDIFREVGVPEGAQTFVSVMSNLASVQALAGEWTQAAESYDAIRRAVEKWEPGRRGPFLTNLSRVETLYRTGQIEDGLRVSRRLLEFREQRYGQQNPETALARGFHAVGLALAKRDEEALKEFRAAVPLLTETTFKTDNDDALNAAARDRSTQAVVESYIALLERVGAAAGPNVATDTFRLADAIRGRFVQKALTAASARMTASDPKLAEAVRREQDLRQQIGTQLGQLNALLGSPPSERDEAGIAMMRKDIDKSRAEHVRVRADIDRRYPEYSELIDPKPPSVAQIKQMLKPGEALLSFYFGRDASFVWAIAHNGKVEFAALRDSAAAVESKIKKLREALEPQAAMISDIPPFDLALSHDLYKVLLEPVKGAWGEAKSLIVVTNGALGLLPLGLLATAPHQLSTEGPTFAGYRAAPWLVRTHAVTMVPSASALATLRRLPPGTPHRDRLIAFGDPWFNAKHATEATESLQLAAAEVQTRGIPLKRRAGPPQGGDSTGLGELPRLPDTADELRSIALALQADPTKALHLGKAANEQLVKTTNLSGFKIVAFATHGLVPGELDGLDQPALALSAPELAGVGGDGLLTMQEILSLKLDADWVILSACNTGAAAGAGAEAASGLGRAFFYAGTRAILVTNWSVHSQSARELVTDLFSRQAADANLSRGEALRRAMIAVMDGTGFVEGGKTVFAYAHPLFWAPYTVIGDGG